MSRLASPRPGKCFAAPTTPDAQSGQKFASIDHGLFGIGRNRARTHHSLRSFECEINYRGEVRIEPQSAAGFADHFAVPAKQLAVASGENIGRRRRRIRSRCEIGPPFLLPYPRM